MSGYFAVQDHRGTFFDDLRIGYYPDAINELIETDHNTGFEVLNLAFMASWWPKMALKVFIWLSLLALRAGMEQRIYVALGGRKPTSTLPGCKCDETWEIEKIIRMWI